MKPKYLVHITLGDTHTGTSNGTGFIDASAITQQEDNLQHHHRCPWGARLMASFYIDMGA